MLSLLGASLVVALSPSPAGLSAPVPALGGGGDDKVDITSPEDEAYFADVPASVTVIAEVTNNSPLEIQEVHLEVDAQDQAMFCEAAGPCEWTVELDEGTHEFRSFVVRNIGGPLFSQFVEVQIGGEPPGGPADDGETGGDEDTGDAGSGSSGASSDGTDDGADGGGDGEESTGGCACSSGGPAHPLEMAGLLLVGAAALRRRAW